MEDGLTLLVWLALELMLLYTGKYVIASLTLGRWRAEHFGQKEGRIYSAAGSLSFIREGRRVITVNGLLFAGLAFYFFLATALICVS